MEGNWSQKSKQRLESIKQKFLVLGLIALASILLKQDTSTRESKLPLTFPEKKAKSGSSLNTEPEEGIKTDEVFIDTTRLYSANPEIFNVPDLFEGDFGEIFLEDKDELPNKEPSEISSFLNPNKETLSNEDESRNAEPDRINIIALEKDFSEFLDKLIVVFKKEKGLTSGPGILSGVLYNKLEKYKADLGSAISLLTSRKEQYGGFLKIINYSKSKEPKFKEEHLNTAIFLYILYENGKLKDIFDFKKDVGVYSLAGVFADKNTQMNLYEKLEYLKRARKEYFLSTPENTEALKVIFAKRVGGALTLSTDDLIELELIEMLCYEAKKIWSLLDQVVPNPMETTGKRPKDKGEKIQIFLKEVFSREDLQEKINPILQELQKN